MDINITTIATAAQSRTGWTSCAASTLLTATGSTGGVVTGVVGGMGSGFGRERFIDGAGKPSDHNFIRSGTDWSPPV